MKNDNIDLYIVSKLDEIGWLFNLRGTDIPYNPLFKSYLILTHDTLTIFISNTQLQSNNTLILYL